MLIETLFKRQRSEGWTDAVFAAELGISRATLSHIRAGNRGIGPYTLRRIVARFPEYSELAFAYLSEKVTNSFSEVTEPAHAA